jgi:hypothetical protein
MPLVVILVGCKKNAGECKTETDALVTLLRGTDPPIGTPYGLTVDLKADRILIDGKRVELEDLVAMLIEARQHVPASMRREIGEGSGGVFIRVDDSVPWSRVVALSQKLDAGAFDHPTFFSARAPKNAPPPRSPIDDELDKQLGSDDSGGNEATALANAMTKVFKPCKPLDKVFHTLASEDGGDRRERMLLSMSEALPECSCDVDMPALRSVMYRLYQDPHPADAHKIVLAKAGKPIALPAATLWKDAAKQLPEGETIWLVAS